LPRFNGRGISLRPETSANADAILDAVARGFTIATLTGG
jgi:hypothetical protein